MLMNTLESAPKEKSEEVKLVEKYDYFSLQKKLMVMSGYGDESDNERAFEWVTKYSKNFRTYFLEYLKDKGITSESTETVVESDILHYIAEKLGLNVLDIAA